jgi:BolA protein
MMIREQIEAKLRAAFDPVYLEVVDESYRHNVPAGSESHFKVVLVSDRFTGERFLNRHRMIYGTLTEELSSTVHALALHTYTIKEWEGLQDTVFASPPCRGAEVSPRNRICNRGNFSSMLREDLSKNGLRAVLFCLKMCAVGAFKDKFAREM